MFMKMKTFIFLSFTLIIGYVLFHIHFFEFSNVLAQPIRGNPSMPAQVQNGTTGNLIHTTTTGLTSIGNSSSKTTMVPYENRFNGISMLYPKTWQASTSGTFYPDLIKFYAPLQNITDFLPAQVSIGVSKYENNGITLPQYSNLTLVLLNISQGQKQLNITNSNPTNIAGNPGYRVIYSMAPTTNSTIELRTLEIWTVLNSKVYLISYTADTTKFNKYLPQVNQMLNSLRISQVP